MTNRRGDQEHHHRGLHAAVEHRAPKVRRVHLRYHRPTRKRRDHRKARRLRGGHEAAEDAAKDDDRQGKGRQRVDEGAPQIVLHVERLFDGQIVAPREHIGDEA